MKGNFVKKQYIYSIFIKYTSTFHFVKVKLWKLSARESNFKYYEENRVTMCTIYRDERNGRICANEFEAIGERGGCKTQTPPHSTQ